jgi:hypothetical protein
MRLQLIVAWCGHLSDLYVYDGMCLWRGTLADTSV